MTKTDWTKFTTPKCWHPAAKIFPIIDSAVDDLAQDIKTNGLMNPVVMIGDLVLDGRTRLLACRKVDVAPIFIDYEKTDGGRAGIHPLTWVISQNLKRRHLTPSQSAAVAANAADLWEALTAEAKKRVGGHPKKGEEPSEPVRSVKRERKTSESVGKTFGVSGRYVEQARALKKANPVAFAEVLADKQTLKKATAMQKRVTAREHQSKTRPKLPKGLQIITGDFRQEMEKLPANSVDLIFTDPPYDRKSLPLYGDLARLAARVLRPGGHLVTYAGHYLLPEIFPLMTDLEYHWTLAVIHAGRATRMKAYGVSVGWKPLLWFIKGARAWDGEISDVILSEAPDKGLHEWEQSTIEATHIIEKLTDKGGIVLDPMVGTGTTLLAARALGRQAIGIDLDPATANVARRRLAGAK